MKTLVFVTGSDGLLGSNLVRELLARGYRVRALVQPGREPFTLAGLDIEFAFCDIMYKDGLVALLKGCTYAVHAASSRVVWPARNPVVRMVNMVGTAHVIEAAKEAGIKRLVHVSSACVFGTGNKKRPGNEDSAFTEGRFGVDYIMSKYLSQQTALEASKGPMEVLVVNPTHMIGAYDSGPGSGKLVIDQAIGSMLFVTPGGKNFVHARDVAVGIANALTMGKNGACYILGNENLSYREFMTRASSITGYGAPRMVIPAWLTIAAGAVIQFLSALRRRRPAFTLPMARIACRYQYYSPAKAVAELNMPQTPVETAISDAYEWFCQHGYVDRNAE